MDRKANHLINEKSPYLVQHAYNPIDWYPWGEEALKKAKEENKPLFISIGYSTCHWCHVMATESFENSEIARIINENFVPIKVDREERADVDSVYMNACVSMNGQGGWPLTVFATPDQKPFFTATYLPPNSRMGRIGLYELATSIAEEWKKGGQRFIDYGQKFTDFLKKQGEIEKETLEKGMEIFHNAFNNFDKSFDKIYGGFGQPPKFPTPHNLMFLLRYYHFENNEKALKMVEKTLISMYKGGIYDHIGSGFCRYSTDEKWLVPHFEKMLYDNALLVITYLEAYQITKKDIYKEIAENTLEFVIRELNSTSGGFWTALDADINGREGLYYTFDFDEPIKVLGEEDGKRFNEYFNVRKQGNYEGRNVLNIIGKETLKLDEKMNELVQAMYHYRKKRYDLKVDDKILVSINSLIICAFIKAYMIMDKDAYRILAEKGIRFIEENMIDDDANIFVSYKDGKSDIMGGLDDYSYFCMALVDMYEATFDARYLKRAILYVNKIVENFEDSEKGGFFMTDKRTDNLIYRPKDYYDGAMPSGNSVMGYVLNKIAKITAKEELMEQAGKHLEYLEKMAGDNGSNMSFALIALMQDFYPSKEIIAVALNKEHLTSIREKQKEFSPGVTYIAKFIEGIDPSEYSDFLWEYEIKNNTTTYYVCENKACNVQNKL